MYMYIHILQGLLRPCFEGVLFRASLSHSMVEVHKTIRHLRKTSTPTAHMEALLTLIYSRLQKVGIFAWDELGWFSFFSKLSGWGTVFLQLYGFY